MTDASNASQVKDELQQLHTAFEEFARAQVAYHNRLVDLYNIKESNNCLKSNGCDGIDTIIPYQSINH